MAAAVVWIPIGAQAERVLEFKASKDKWISMTMDKEITYSRWSPIFRVDAYDLPGDRPFYATDRSLFGIRREDLPPDVRYANIAHDGDGLALMIQSDEQLSSYKAFEKSILKAPYLLLKEPRVLIIGAGGGVDVGMALQSGAQSVLAVELDPLTVDLVSDRYADFVGHLYDRPEVTVVADEGRSFLRRSDRTFDIIQMTGVDTMAALNSGAYVLAENYLYTTEACADFMDHLSPDGIFSMAIFDFHYDTAEPGYVYKHVSNLAAAFERRGIQDLPRHLVVISSTKVGYPWVILMAKMSPFSTSEVGKIGQFAKAMDFDIWYLPGQWHNNPMDIVVNATIKEREAYIAGQFLRGATTDDSPFFFQRFHLMHILQNLSPKVRQLAMGQVILLLILLFSIVSSVALIIIPLVIFRRGGLQSKHKWNYILYFAALGLGFIFLEISYIQRFILFLGYPTYALTVILFGILTFSGVGSYLSGRSSLAPRNIILVAFCLLAVIALGYMALLPPIFEHFLGASRPVRVAISLVLLFPLGLALGVFFPTGIKIISADDKRFIPWAWGINGCASVIGTVLSIIIAMSYGFGTVTVLAVIVYMVGVVAMFRVGGMDESV